MIGHRRPDPGAAPEPIEIWSLGPDGQPIEELAVPDGVDLADVATQVVSAARASFRPHRPVRHLRPGGAAPAAPPRQGQRGEVVQPVMVRPDAAVERARSGALLVPEIRRLRVVTQHPDDSDGVVSWAVEVTHWPIGRSDAVLRVGPTPSGNLTVVEILPAPIHWIRRRTFERSGIRIALELSRRLWEGARSGSW